MSLVQPTMTHDVIHRILALFDIEGAEVLSSQKGYRNTSYPLLLPDGSKLNLIMYKKEPEIEQRIINANAVSNFLASKGFPARTTVDSRIVQINTPSGNRFASLYGYLPGSTIPWEGYTQDHIKLLGKAMSDMHSHLQDFEVGAIPLFGDEFTPILERMERYFTLKDVQMAMLHKLGVQCPLFSISAMRKLLKELRNVKDQQVLHMDFVRGNILFDATAPMLTNSPYELGNCTLTGVIDFEKVAVGHPVIDVARTLAFLLIDCKYKPESKVRKYFLLSGYQKRGQATLDQSALEFLEPLIELFLLYDFYKFLRHNPYEFLNQNEHFIRTRDSLLKRHIITALK